MEIICLLLMGLQAQRAAQLPTGDEVVARFITAQGGEQRLRATKSLRLSAEVRLLKQVHLWTSGTPPWKKLSDLQVLQTHRKHRAEHTRTDGSRLVDATDGDRAWHIDEDGHTRFLKDTELSQHLRQHTAVHDCLWWSQRYVDIRCTAKRVRYGLPMYELEFVSEDGQIEKRWFHTESGLLLEEMRTDPGGMKTSVFFADYREVAGVLLPHRRTVSVGGVSLQYLIRKAERNVELPPDAFVPDEPQTDDAVPPPADAVPASAR